MRFFEIWSDWLGFESRDESRCDSHDWAMNARFTAVPFFAIQKVPAVVPRARVDFACTLSFGFRRVFQRRIANHPPRTMSMVPQKPGHQTGMPGFATSA